MQRLQGVIGASVSFFLLAISICTQRTHAQTATPGNAAKDSKDQALVAVNIIREINTAEVMICRSKEGKINENEKFQSWGELLNAPCFKQAQRHFSGARFSNVNEVSLSPRSEIVPGLELRLVVSPDGKHYNLWLGQKLDVHCGFAFFSDERGVI